MKKNFLLSIMFILICFVSCEKKHNIVLILDNDDDSISVEEKKFSVENSGDVISDKKYHVCVPEFSNNIELSEDYTKTARKRVIDGFKLNPDNSDIGFTDKMTSDCQAIVYGIIEKEITAKIDAKDVVVAYKIKVHVVDPKTNKEIASFSDSSDNSIENSARVLNLFPQEEEKVELIEADAENISIEENQQMNQNESDDVKSSENSVDAVDSKNKNNEA